jgi:hypothetical protein
MAKFYVYSTMSSDNDYINYENGIAKSKITIAGKANVANKVTLITKTGVLTILNENEYDLLKENSHFKKHLSNGFLIVESKMFDEEKVAKDMIKKDKSSQKKKEDFKNLKAEVVEE